MQTLQRGWSKDLNEVFQSTNNELIISSPYISKTGVEFLVNNLSKDFKLNGTLKFVTDLSPKNIYQGSTDPNSFKTLFNSLNTIHLFHLSRLHAKVYISDDNKAIITSGNLTAGGIYNNFEYGIFIDTIEIISAIKKDVLGYGNLGAEVSHDEINSYCSISEEVKALYLKKEKSVRKEIEGKFEEAVLKASDELIRLKLGKGALHTIFEKTIHFLLQKNGPLSTVTLQNLIQEIHPDLCDNNVDRVINGIHFGKKWKHIVRTSLQNFKKKGFVELMDGKWRLVG